MISDFAVIIFGIVCLLVGFISAKFGDKYNQEKRKEQQEWIKIYRIGLKQGYNTGLKEARIIATGGRR